MICEVQCHFLKMAMSSLERVGVMYFKDKLLLYVMYGSLKRAVRYFEEGGVVL